MRVHLHSYFTAHLTSLKKLKAVKRKPFLQSLMVEFHNFSFYHLGVWSVILAFFLSRLSTDNEDSIFKAIEALSKRLDSLGTNMERKLDLVNVNVMNMSERTTTLEIKGMHIYIDFQLGLYCFALLRFVIGLRRKLGPLSQTRRCKTKNKSDSMMNISPTCGCSRWVTNPPLWYHFPTQLNLY